MQILFLFIMLPAQNEVTKYVAMTKYVTVCGQIYWNSALPIAPDA